MHTYVATNLIRSQKKAYNIQTILRKIIEFYLQVYSSEDVVSKYIQTSTKKVRFMNQMVKI